LRLAVFATENRMPVYYFNIHDGSAIADTEGHVLPDLDAARRVAIRLAGDVIREIGDNFWRGEEWRMDVTDHAGAILFTLHFSTTAPPAAEPAQLIVQPLN